MVDAGASRPSPAPATPSASASGLLILAVSIFTTWSYGSGSRGIKLYEWFLRGVIALMILSFGSSSWSQHRQDPVGRTGQGVHRLVRHSRSSRRVDHAGAGNARRGGGHQHDVPLSLFAPGQGLGQAPQDALALGPRACRCSCRSSLVTSLIIIAMAVTGVYDAAQEVVRTGMKPLERVGRPDGVLGEQPAGSSSTWAHRP